MKIPSKIGDSIFITLLFTSLITMFCCLVWMVTGIWFPTAILLAILAIIIVPIYFGTNYQIKDDALYINCGLFLINYKIDYSKIVSMTDIDNLRFAPALCYHRIAIRFIQGEKIKSILISPSDKEKFKKLIHEQIDKTMPNNNVIDIDETQKDMPTQKISATQNDKILQKLQKRMKSAENAREYREMQNAVEYANIALITRQRTSFNNSKVELNNTISY